jgi:hypothetical protein
MIYLYHQRGKENPPNQRGRKSMKTVDMMKWGKGYYVTMRIGCNVQREWCKTKKAATALMKKWQKGD